MFVDRAAAKVEEAGPRVKAKRLSTGMNHSPSRRPNISETGETLGPREISWVSCGCLKHDLMESTAGEKGWGAADIVV